MDMMVWDCGIPGKEGGIWAGGVYPLTITFSNDYPALAPKVVFTPPLPHPNIFASGAVCLSILSYGWKPTIGVKQVYSRFYTQFESVDPAGSAGAVGRAEPQEPSESRGLLAVQVEQEGLRGSRQGIRGKVPPGRRDFRRDHPVSAAINTRPSFIVVFLCAASICMRRLCGFRIIEKCRRRGNFSSTALGCAFIGTSS